MLYDSNGNVIGASNSEKKWIHNGVLDALCVTDQICDIEWTTTESGMPKANHGTLSKGTTVKGMPYSSASVEDGYIGIGISLYTFMSAVQNPRSVLYTTQSKGYTGYAYYGTVCTSLICAAWGLPCLFTTVAMSKWDGIEAVSFTDLEVGDMILSLSEGHAKMISGIKRDSSGVITYVRTSESTYDDCITNEYQAYATFASEHSSYTGYRYKKINSVESYKPVPYMRFFDEPVNEAVYPDIMTCFGDKVTRKYGTDIVIDVLDGTGYSTIKVYKDGELIDTKSTIDDFTISSPAVGAYEVQISGDGKVSSTFFDIVDCHMSVSGDTLTFDTTYKATAIGGVPTYSTDGNGKATSWNNPKRNRILTDEENVAKEIDISEFTSDNDCSGGFRLFVQGVYGSVSFEKLYS